MYGIKITINGSAGWIVGKDSDVLLFPDKAAASAGAEEAEERRWLHLALRNHGSRVSGMGEEVNRSARWRWKGE